MKAWVHKMVATLEVPFLALSPNVMARSQSLAGGRREALGLC